MRIEHSLILKKMSEDDKKLIETAKKLNSSQWGVCSDLERKASSKEAKEMIKRIAIRLYHIDENKAGIL